MAVDLRDRSLRHAYDSASFHTLAAIDHLFAVRLLLNGGGLPSFAIMTMFRVALETAFAAYWTVEPDDPADRRERGFAATWVDLSERAKTEVAARGGLEARAEQAELLDEAEAHGIVLPSITDPSGKAIPRRLRLVFPSTVRLVQMYPEPKGCEVEYRYLSGYSHGKLWAQRAGLQPERSVDLDLEMASVPTATPDLHILACAGLAVDALARAIGRLGTLHEPA
jgi:hypothetical protein